MDYELEAQPTPTREFTSAHRTIIKFWVILWSAAMIWFFIEVNSQNGGWFDGPLFAAMIAGYGLVVGLITLAVIVGFIRLAIKDQSIRSLLLTALPLCLLIWVLVAFWA